MTSKEITIKNKSGFDTKTATNFITKASSFSSSISVEKDERSANAKSLLGLLSLGMATNSKIVLKADGEDEKEALEALEKELKASSE